MYEKISSSSTKVELPTAVEWISKTDADAFWLLSRNEINNLVNNKVGYLPEHSTAGDYWLRSPVDSRNYTSWGVMGDGSWNDYREIYKPVCGIRPAFLI